MPGWRLAIRAVLCASRPVRLAAEAHWRRRGLALEIAMGDSEGILAQAWKVSIVAALMALSACSGASQPSPADALERAATATPADARLAGLYRQSCQTCHAAADSGAPLTLDRAAWDPRWAKGQDALLQSVVTGFNAMPAGGQCFSCTPDDYRALIAFMAGRE